MKSAWGLSDDPDSGTIYKTLRIAADRDTEAHWGTPTKYKRWDELGITMPPSATHNPIIDGLAIDIAPDAAGGGVDEVMFSLASTASYPVPAESQLQYVKVDSSLTVRRVVVKPTGSGPSSLGRHMRSGRGIGDFCTKDPFAEFQLNTEHNILDDFFVARRLSPGMPYVVPSTIPTIPDIYWEDFLVSHAASVLTPKPIPPVPMLHERKPMRRPPLVVSPQPIVIHPGFPVIFSVPELGLAVAGYRQTMDGQPSMRTCMSWPRPAASSGDATVQWGTMIDYLSDPPVVVWGETIPLTYSGEPLTADHLLPDNGVPVEGTKKALAARWTLQAGGKLYTSPISALRY